MIYDFSDDEVNALGTLIDEALKATGIKYAINAGVLLTKLRAPYQPTAQTPVAAPVSNSDATAKTDTPRVPERVPIADAA